MPKYRFLRVSITWPKAEENIMLNVIDEDEDPVEISGYDFATLIHMGWDELIENPDPDENANVDFAEILYPDSTRVYVNGIRVSLSKAHRAFEITFEKALRAGLDIAAEGMDENAGEASQELEDVQGVASQG